MRVLVFALALTVLPPAAPADPSATVERAKACDSRAKEKPLTDAQYQAYMKTCLASEGPPPAPLDTVKALDRRCAAAANARSLTGQERFTFLDQCRRKS
jgi:hypothetical protein